MGFNAEKTLNKLLSVLKREKNETKDGSLTLTYNLLVDNKANKHNSINRNYVEAVVDTAIIAINEVGLGRTSIAALFLYHAFIGEKEKFFIDVKVPDNKVISIATGLKKISSLGQATKSSQAESYRRLLLTLADDVRVILIRLAEQVALMRSMTKQSNENQLRIAYEAAYLYAPLAHRLGLYLIKSEMEDLSLKYTDSENYKHIAKRLEDTMHQRKKFIKDFILPIKQSLDKQDIKYEVKGRPKSIHSIHAKMKKKGIGIEDIYDLFAIRIILDSEVQNEKADCWQVYSAVTEIYQPNPLRLRDWISIPKSNGYESLHTTVIGPGGRWVEVQIRTERMNDIAEMGVAAHWKYKGQQGEKGIDEWLSNIREILENEDSDADSIIDDFKLNLYNKEIFVFTPKGDLKQFPEGATVLDFAFEVHTDVGTSCTGGKVNGKAVPIRHKLANGDKVEILTSKNQKPTLDWLKFVVTSRAQKKIRQKVNEQQTTEAEHGKELLMRRLKNWKIEYNDGVVQTLLKKYKFNTAQEFYCQITEEKIDIAEIKEFLTEETTEKEQVNTLEKLESKGTAEPNVTGENFLVIDEKVIDLDYKLAKCCSPIMGDNIFGFVTINEGIKIHRTNCPNAAQLLGKYGYRVVNAKWTRRGPESIFPVNIRISGEDQPGILNKISEVIAKDNGVSVRNINFNADKGEFHGIVKITVKDINHLSHIINQLSLVKGVFNVSRIDSE